MDNSKLHLVVVNGFLKNSEGRYLILKRSEREIAFPGKWGVPGGKVEGKDGVKETLKKEFLEETGLEIRDDMDFFGDYEFTRPDGFHVVGMRFICRCDSEEVHIDERDFTEYAWVNLDELDKYDLIEGVKKDLESLRK